MGSIQYRRCYRGEQRSPYINIIPSVDSIQEFKVLTGNMEAQYGGGAGTVTNVQIKSGSNAFHGDLFEFVRNTAMDARNYFRTVQLPKQVLKQNQFGGTIGGPILKDRTFFLAVTKDSARCRKLPHLATFLRPLKKTATSRLYCRQYSSKALHRPPIRKQPDTRQYGRAEYRPEVSAAA